MKSRKINKLSIVKQTISNLQQLTAITGGSGCACGTGDSCGIICYME